MGLLGKRKSFWRNNDQKIVAMMFARPGRIRAYCSVSGGLDALRDAGGVSDVEVWEVRRPRRTTGVHGERLDEDDYSCPRTEEKSVETSSSGRKKISEEEEEKIIERRELHAQLNREDSAYGYPNASHRNIINANSSNEGPTTPPNQQECEQPPPRVGAKRCAVPHSGSMPEFGSEAKLWARRGMRRQPQRLDVRLQCAQLGVIESPSSYV